VVVASLAAVVGLVGCINLEPSATGTASPNASARSRHVALADVTGDGIADPLVVTSEGHLVRLDPCGAGCFAPAQSVGTGVVTLATDDLDGDGVHDVVVGTATGVVAYFGGAAGPGRAAGLVESDQVVVDATTLDAEVATGDFDGDGNLDVAAFGQFDDEFFPVDHHTEAFGDGDGGFSPPVERSQALGSGTFVSLRATGDVDGDGDDETFFHVGIAQTADMYIRVYGDDADDRFSISTPDLAGDVAVGDLDGDGLDDVVVRRYADPSFPEFPVIYWVLRSTGTGFTGFGPGGAITTLSAGPITAAPDLHLVDLDADGHVDVVASAPQADRISWWHGSGDGSFTVYDGSPRIDRSAGPDASQIAVEAGGTRPDLLVTNPTSANAQVTYLTNVSKGR
jgi:hypothetical protein